MSDTKTTPATRYATPRLTDGGEIRERPRFAALRSLYRRKLALIAAIVVLTVTLVAILAPVLTSTGEGSHVAPFSYYALLNAGILVMAWFRHWRWLNWTGFVFTFVIGASWGYQYYQPEYYASTQPFLILFFLFYLTVSMLFARRQALERLRGV